MNEMIFEALKLVVMVATLLIVKKGIPLIQKWIDAKTLQEMRDWAADGVRWAQDYMQSAEGAQKRQAVINALLEIRDKEKFNITDDQIEILVRAAYTVMKDADRDVYLLESTDA